MNTISTAIAACAVLLVAVVWRYIVIFCRDTEKFVRDNNKASVTLKQLTEMQCTIADVADSVVAMNKTLAKLRSRQGMRDLRERDKDGETDVPDSKMDPAGYKRVMRLRLANQNQK